VLQSTPNEGSTFEIKLPTQKHHKEKL